MNIPIAVAEVVHETSSVISVMPSGHNDNAIEERIKIAEESRRVQGVPGPAKSTFFLYSFTNQNQISKK